MNRLQVTLPVDSHDGFNIIVDKHFANSQINCILQLNGKINEKLLQDAVLISLKVQPILKHHLVENGNQLLWEPCENFDTIQVYSIIETQETEVALQEFVSERYSYPKDCQLKMRIIRSNADTLCVKIHHACSDAAGLKQYIHLLIEIYNTLEEGNQYVIKTHDCHHRSQELVLQLPAIESITNPEELLPITKETVGFPSNITDNKEQYFLLEKINSQEFCAIKLQGKKHGATLNDVFLTAYNKALAKYATIENNSISVCSTVDLRYYLPPGPETAICNFSAMNEITIDNPCNEPFTETLAKIVRETKKAKNNHFALKGSLDFFNTFATVGFKDMDLYFEQQRQESLRTGLSNPWLSNVGIINEQLFNFGLLKVIDCYIIGPASFAPGFSAVPSTYNNMLTLSVNFFQSTTPKKMIREFINTMLTELRNFAG